MISAIGFSEVMASLGSMAIIFLCACVVAWFGYCISSIARTADALERIADKLEDEDAEEEGGAK
ncbi:MAG: hypothetical protein J6Z49_08075 [Kiritimatiellae bacterium]|nr:hypothetical protein [Kiritimatiellia bacterium]